MSNVGLRIISRKQNPEMVKLSKEFAPYPTPNIADNMNRLPCVDAGIKLMNTANLKLAGVAFTVKTRPGDNLLIHKALDMAGPGDVIVVDAQGDMTNSLLGELICFYAMKRGINGMVIDGAIRDADTISELNFPMFARGVTPKGPYKDGPGEINVPISCGGQIVNPGDIIVGDYDGVVVISPKDAVELLEKTKATMAKEQDIVKQIEEGKWDRTWIDATLKAKGAEFIEE